MPLYKQGVWAILRAQRRGQILSMMIEQSLLKLSGSVHLLRHEYLKRWSQRKRSQVKQLVVYRAQRDTILNYVWAIGLMPLDMCGFKCDGDIPDAKIEPTYRATISICG